MDREQAEKALGIIREVIENTREDLVEHNWGTIWLIHSVSNALGFASIGLWIEPRNLPVFWYLLPLGILGLVNMIVIALFASRDRGTRSYVELQVHGIWVTFILVTLAGAAVIHFTGVTPRLFGPLIALTSCFGFAMMGIVFHRSFILLAVLFAMVAMGTAALQLPVTQWYWLAAAWGMSMLLPGLVLTRERRRRDRHGRETRIL